MKFDHRTAVVTGAAGRIGRALCKRFCADGVAVALTDLALDKTEAVAAELRAAGGNVKAYAMDVADTASVDAAAAQILADFGKVDILVNNAGVWPRKPYLALDEAEWSWMLDLNLTGVFRVTKAFLPQMVERKYGRIINLGSIAGEVGLPGMGAYSVAKAGVWMFTRTLAMEMGKKGVTVNCVSPGMIGNGPHPNEGTWIGLGAGGDEVAQVIELLAADESWYLTGADYPVDGGRTLGAKNCTFQE